MQSSLNEQSIQNENLEADDNYMKLVEKILIILSMIFAIVTIPLSFFFIFKLINEYERAVILRLGRLKSGGPRGPGVIFILPCIDMCFEVDIRTITFDVPPQEILTKDSVTVRVDAVVYYSINDPVKSVTKVFNHNQATSLLATTILRNALGTRSLSEILSDREAISRDLNVTLDEATDPWGVRVERVEITDVHLPIQLQRAMAAEAEAAREAKAKIIAAEGELNASKNLKEASDILASNSVTLQLRYLQTLTSISAEKTSTIIFPLPIDLLKPFLTP